ncbi:hypothetical protein LX95_01290 [Mesonia algae]|uniref:Uncharacterized protein n=1 Tax=Mesonia algae TaxID=213248 RepID=A0A2W7I5V5_9FLAO|nr:hypothetical protein [Mesonia algae]PZW41609.1 hypothetical protein LX95_01290 [Mesonia algae]
MKKPTGFVATCQCDEIIGVIDVDRTTPKDTGSLLGNWLSRGCKIEPRFSGTWSVTITSCKCKRN